MSSPLTTTAASSLITTTGVTSVATATTVSVTTSTITTSSTTSSSTTSSSTTSSSTTSSSTTSSSTTSSSTTSSSTTGSSTTTSTTTNFLFRWNSTGITLAGVTGSAGASSTQLSTPYSMTLDSSNTLYIADRNNNRVQKFLTGSSTGTTIAGQSNGTGGAALNYLNYPSDVEVDINGNIYVVDSHNHRVLFLPNGSSSGTIVAGNGKRFPNL
ncbi:unnamed protein product [Rotaria sordida]|uniref:NHL repeat-containing protein n=1 Tax=Rotaria sordida TaxID=392033 RepID=A0A819LUW3_9BILA|nr:unnamed protein product [Rotaria sordida]